MKDFKEKYLRPGRKPTDQFLIASVLSFLIFVFSIVAFPIGIFAFKPFEMILKDHDAAVFLKDYFDFSSIWVGYFLAVVLIIFNWPMLKAVKYCSPKINKDVSDGVKKNRAGNNIRGLLIGLALGFSCNFICILISVIAGDIHLEYSGFKMIPFLLFFICVFIQSAGEELADRWFLYQKIRRRYKAPWIPIIVNSLCFMAMHLPNPGVSFQALLEIFIIGILFSLFVYYYNGLWIAMAFHAAWNFTQSIVFGLPNSGVVSAYSIFKLDAASATNGVFYNVNFGVEGSIGANVIIFALTVLVFVINRGKGEHTDIWAEADKAANKPVEMSGEENAAG